eukprot:4210791-Pyramimonas_sp.AAC.1
MGHGTWEIHPFRSSAPALQLIEDGHPNSRRQHKPKNEEHARAIHGTRSAHCRSTITCAPYSEQAPQLVIVPPSPMQHAAILYPAPRESRAFRCVYES